ncbi:oxidoreductase (plasmid) [Sphingobium sp. SJ10-10]|uniref:oxidoreductase n=1 Tax=Sphingobium sp. SJ10-10 TaxID=3114999 RepID=UPI002E19EBD3|nr:oxidoreductase [Sphingobium sp. SJ10-10]
MTGWGQKNWFITGASAGFGKAIARGVLEKGGRVIATARNIESLADLLALGGDRVLPVRLDVRDGAAVMEAVEAAERFGGIDVLLNNAGYGFIAGVEEARDEEIAAQFDVNFFGPLRLIRAALPGMRQRGEGYIVNMSSIGGMRGLMGAGFYAATKFALEGLSEALAGEAARFGLRVLIVEPGYFRTDFSGRSLSFPVAPHPDYDFLVRQRMRAASVDGMQPGDPERALQALLAAMSSDTPPMRLLLGSDAHQFAVDALRARQADVEIWRAVTESTDFPGGD